MTIIANNGNLKGPCEFSGTQKQIELAIKTGFDVKIDITLQDNGFFSGNPPEHKIELDFLRKNVNSLWLHCRNIEALDFFNTDGGDFNCFWLQYDDYAFTSHQYLLVPPSMTIPKEYGVALHPELDEFWSLKDAWGILTDYPSEYNKLLLKTPRKRKKS